MKRLFFVIVIVSFAWANFAYAQKQAQQDNGQFIAVVQTTATNHQVHYTLTNQNTVAMDFSLYKQVSNGSWDVTHHLDLQPGGSYEDVNSFTGLTGKYVVFSAPHSDWASFPSQFEVAKLEAGSAATATTPPPATTAPPAPVASSTPPATAPVQQQGPIQLPPPPPSGPPPVKPPL
ncbi:MAG TPA: hypothetical protein VG367_04615 [Mucilaginibacter sp.]|jgi:hypothetical protein|nr:hypothetical protein [Mucilaginibacter sp.]